MPANDCKVAAKLALNVRFRDRPIGDLAAEVVEIGQRVFAVERTPDCRTPQLIGGFSHSLPRNAPVPHFAHPDGYERAIR